MKENTFGYRVIRALDAVIDMSVLITFLLLLLYGCYALWDSKQLHHAASSEQYQVYKPGENDYSFEQLIKINPDVFGWLTVYGTKIDYPLVQGKDNEKYVFTDVTNQHSMSGSIFMDYRNARDFSDFNTIIFGHHMAESAMFGDLGNFLDKKYFDQRKYGNLYFDGKDHGIEFFAFMEVDAFDNGIFGTPVTGTDAQQTYLTNLLEKSKHLRSIEVTTDDQLVLLSTCTSSSTNGRHILVGRVTDQVFPVPKEFADKEKEYLVGQESLLDKIKHLPIWLKVAFIFLFVVVLLFLLVRIRKSKMKKNR